MPSINPNFAANHPGRAGLFERRNADNQANPQDRQANHMIHRQVVQMARSNHNGGHLTADQFKQIQAEENAVEGGGGTQALLNAMQQNFG